MSRPALLLAAGMVHAGLALVGPNAYGHERGADRRIILDITGPTVTALVSWSLPAGDNAERIRALADASGDGVVREPMEHLTRAMLVVPRMLDGLGLRVDERTVEAQLTDLHVRDGALDGPRRGLEAMALFDVPVSTCLDDGVATIELMYDDGDGHVIVEAQARDGATIINGSLTLRDGPVAGPALLHPGDTATIAFAAPSRP